MEEHSRRNKTFVEGLAPKSAFKMGLLAGLGVMFIIGFFILLGVVLTGDGKTAKNSGGTGTNPTPTNPIPTNPAQGNTGPIVVGDVTSDDYVRGNPKGDITIIEFSDIECPFCQNFHTTMNQIVENNKEVKWVYRHFPLTSIHPGAQKKAEAAECIGDLGGNDAFWAYLDSMFGSQRDVSQLGALAAELGVNQNDFQECLDSSKFASKVQAQSREAQTAGGGGTPYSVLISGDTTSAINGAQPIGQVQNQIDALN